MLKERLQILVDSDQRSRLQAEAQRQERSVGAIVRDAIDAHLGTARASQKMRALEEMRSARVDAYIPPEELRELIDTTRAESFAAGIAGARTERAASEG